VCAWNREAGYHVAFGRERIDVDLRRRLVCRAANGAGHRGKAIGEHDLHVLQRLIRCAERQRSVVGEVDELRPTP
jgi:hypothetical protein